LKLHNSIEFVSIVDSWQ